MFSIAAIGLQFVYGVGVLGLAVYGLHALWLTVSVRRMLGTMPSRGPQPGHVESDDNLPGITIQLPIYNEKYVIERLIDACVNQDYPRQRLQIQVLDDSTDETQLLVQQRVAHWQQLGVNVEVVHRTDRVGYKAGALDHALKSVQHPFVAIFDADFLPPPEFLREAVPYFLGEGNRQVGFVQGRWDHLNRDYSLLTASQALALDGHFAIEQEGRQADGFYFGFNGSAGIWRRDCITDPQVGGWQADTLCEDLDLSYRAQMTGWRPVYVNGITAPAEIPPQLSAFKRQQFRWAKGSIQTLRKLGKRVWHSDRPLFTRCFGLFHLGSYLLHPLLLMLLLIAGPLMLLGIDPAAPLTALSLATIGPPILFASAQLRLHRDRWWRNFLYLPILMLLGTGICLNNTRAVWQGLRTEGGEFLRTPKFDVAKTGDQWRFSRYRLPLAPMLVAELALIAYALGLAGYAISLGKWWSVPFMLLYAGGFALVIGVELWQSRADRTQPRRTPSADYSDGRAMEYEKDGIGAS
jgi:cellulose synthase/poly-beta-1,6-N-acetylglucosamine synthase-like glycosyltransferase